MSIGAASTTDTVAHSVKVHPIGSICNAINITAGCIDATHAVDLAMHVIDANLDPVTQPVANAPLHGQVLVLEIVFTKRETTATSNKEVVDLS